LSIGKAPVKILHCMRLLILGLSRQTVGLHRHRLRLTLRQDNE
jgi:hypothetical protein